MSTIKIMSVVGARPNFMKIAPLVHAVEKHNRKAAGRAVRIEHFLVHTGQHYDQAMSASFFEALNIPKPDVDLGIGSGSHAEQVGQTMIAFEKVVHEWKPDWIVVVGDVNATCACSITAKKEHVKLAHIEAGLRSFDLDMPEEINRMVTDRLADLLFTTDEMADANLQNEGTSSDRITRVGNIMIDTLEQHRDAATALDIHSILRTYAMPESTATPDIQAGHFAAMTLHRPSNVDDPGILRELMDYITSELSPHLPLVWPIHPRTLKNLKSARLWDQVRKAPGIRILHPVGYLEMLKLNNDAQLMLTDSGGLQEECCILGTPCLTLRWNTERPKTLVEHGGLSILAGNSVDRIRTGVKELMDKPKREHRPPLWDGHTGERVVAHLVQQLRANQRAT